MRIRHIAAAALALISVPVAVAVSAEPATAASCTYNVSTPWKSTSTDISFAANVGTGCPASSYYRVVLYRTHWSGDQWLQASNYFSNGWGTAAMYHCTGTGTQSYFSVLYNGDNEVLETSQFRTSC
ncbi:hypothetical protein [Hamadaea tsunoensis]|uniref:hypothetical protein n=1 Tax=Hamadaea tsunoensis TaxID=53368 RepID=UPI00041FC846|nr:hypothetical protein [Hamadaea tsunoensis]